MHEDHQEGMEVVVTGAAGVLGQYVVAELLGRGHRVRALVRQHDGRASWLERSGAALHTGDLFDERSLHRALRGATGLVHCAARENYDPRGQDEMRRLLVDGTSAILRAARRRGVDRIVHVSSMLAVGLRRDKSPMDEQTPWRGADLPRVAAIHCRREAEERVMTAARAGLPAIVVNPDAIVGRRADAPDGTPIRVGRFASAMPRVGSVAAVRDVALGCCLALERGTVAKRYILGGDNQSLQEVAQRLGGRSSGRAMLRTPALAMARLVGRPPTGAVRLWGWNTCADSTLARTELGYAPEPGTGDAFLTHR